MEYRTIRKRGGASEIWATEAPANKRKEGDRLVGVVVMLTRPRTYVAELVRPTSQVYAGPSKMVAESEVIRCDRQRQAARATYHAAQQG